MYTKLQKLRDFVTYITIGLLILIMATFIFSINGIVYTILCLLVAITGTIVTYLNVKLFKAKHKGTDLFLLLIYAFVTIVYGLIFFTEIMGF